MVKNQLNSFNNNNIQLPRLISISINSNKMMIIFLKVSQQYKIKLNNRFNKTLLVSINCLWMQLTINQTFITLLLSVIKINNLTQLIKVFLILTKIIIFLNSLYLKLNESFLEYNHSINNHVKFASMKIKKEEKN